MTSHLRPSAVTPVRVGDLAPDRVRVLGDADTCVTGVGLDSRTVVPGDLYAALPGANVHGARFAASAVETGARAVLTDEAGVALVEQQGLDVPLLVTDDPRAILGEVSAVVYGEPARALRCIGITGTNGKTTTAYLIDGGLRALGERTGLVGTVETRVGDRRVASVRTTPESCDLQGLLALMVEDGVGALTMEVSSHALVLHRVDGVVYDVACFTNLSQDHLDFHHTMTEYARAKASLFTPARSRRGVICVDDDWGRQIADEAGVPVVTVANSDDRRADWVLEADGGDPSFVLTPTVPGDGARALRLTSPIPGDFNRTNTAVAALALLALGRTADELERALAAPTSVPGRAEVVDLGDGAPRAVVDFAHTPEAVRSVLTALRAGTVGPLVAVLGAGGDRDPGKRPLMGRAAALAADVVVVTDDNPRHEDPALIRAAVLEGAQAGVDSEGDHAREAREVPGRDAAIEAAIREAGPTGTVAVLGKGHETGQQIGDVVHPYDDRDAVARAWSRIRAEDAGGDR